MSHGQPGSWRSELGYLSEGPSLASSQRPLSDTLGHWDRESSLRPGQYTAMLRTPASENGENIEDSERTKVVMRSQVITMKVIVLSVSGSPRQDNRNPNGLVKCLHHFYSEH